MNSAPLYTKTAWELIGWDNGTIRIHGGRAVYQAVLFNANGRQQLVKLARLEPLPDMRVREVARYVHPDTLIDVLEERYLWRKDD